MSEKVSREMWGSVGRGVKKCGGRCQVSVERCED